VATRFPTCKPIFKKFSNGGGCNGSHPRVGKVPFGMGMGKGGER